MKGLFFCLLVMSISGTSFAEEAKPVENTGKFHGNLVEKGTKIPVAGANLFLEPGGYTASTDEQGNFSIENIFPGTYRFIIVAISYKKIEDLSIVIKSGIELSQTYYLEPEKTGGFETVVEEARKAPDPGRQTLDREEIKKIPGTGGDPILAVQALPGVTPAPAGNGYFYARGSGPFDNVVFLDRVPVFLPLHFTGLDSTINPDLIQTLDFFAGGFEARFGDAMGAVIDMTSRNGRQDRFGAKINTSPVQMEGRVEGPVGKDSTLYLSGRKGLLEYYIPSSDEGTFIPVFNDYQAKFNHHFSDQNEISFLVFGSYDGFSFKSKKPNPRDPLLDNFNSAVSFHDQGITLKSILTPRLSSILTLFHDNNATHFNIGAIRSVDVDSDQLRLKEDLTYDLGKQYFAFGVEGGHANLAVDLFIPVPCPPSDPNCTFSNSIPKTAHLSEKAEGGDFYLADTLHLTPVFDLTLGGRLDYFGPTEARDLSPRISALYKFRKNQRIKASYGHYFEWPDRNGEFIEGYGTPGIGSSRSTHYVVGYEQDLNGGVDLDFQVYYKTMDFLFVPSAQPGMNFDNSGIGYAAGAEIFLRHKLTDRFFGWISYSYLQGRLKDDRQDWRISEYERPHTLTLVGSYQMNERWNMGGRWRYISGTPYTPLVDSSFNTATNQYDLVFGPVNSARLDATHQLDLRVEYKKVYNTWMMTYYLEIWNLYNHLNPAGVSYETNSQNKLVQKVQTLYEMIPFIGLMAEF
ncbi:MAG: TonB-dependent receptor [Nitrospirae bacterium]|nr:TonB-dependent receptor [Nitrospirota bacterium]